MNKREALFNILSLTGAIFGGYYGGGLIQPRKTNEFQEPEGYTVRSGVFIRGEEKIITDDGHALRVKVNEQVFETALRLVAEHWGYSDALNTFLNRYPLRIAVNVDGLEGLARYKQSFETPKPEIQISPEFLTMYSRRQGPNWGPPERVIFHEFRHLVQDATGFLQNSTEVSISMLSGCTALGTLTGIRRGRQNIAMIDDDTHLERRIENAFWGTAIGFGGGLAAATELKPKEIDAEIFSTTALIERDVVDLNGLFFNYYPVE